MLSRLITRELARLHSIEPTDGKVPEGRTCFATIKKWLDTLPTQFEDAAKQEK